MSNKTMKLTDIQKTHDIGKMIRRGHVKIFSKKTGNLLFEGLDRKLESEGDNKVIVPGSILTARKFFHSIVPSINTPSYNTALGLDGIMSLTTSEEIDSEICLFCVGTDGCGVENSQVIDVDYTKWIDPASLIPFQYRPSNSDLSAEQRKKFFGRKTTNNGMFAYYFKAFDTQPEIHIEYLDGTSMDENLYSTDNPYGGEVYVTMKMSVDAGECRDYFKTTTGINSARMNTISLCTAYPKTINGYTYYQSIRPVTKYNFSNKTLIDENDGFDIIYDLYF